MHSPGPIGPETTDSPDPSRWAPLTRTVVHKGVIKEVPGDGAPPTYAPPPYEALAIEAILHPM